MGSVNIDNTGSGADVTLSSDGTSLLLDGTAVGGGGDPDLYADNYDGTSTAPSATGSNAIALGRNATALGEDCVAIGNDANAQASFGSAGFSMGEQADASAGSLSLGNFSSASGSASTAIGTSAQASATNASALGNDASAAGSDAVALGKSRASGSYSLAAAIANNTSSYGATGTNSIAIGKQNKATDNRAVAIGGSGNIAAGPDSVVIGGQNNTAGTFANGSAIASGDDSHAYGYYSIALGNRGRALEDHKYAHGIYPIGSQYGRLLLGSATTDATATTMISGGLSPSTNNQLVLQNNSAFAFYGTIVARQDATSGTACAAWKIEGLIRREGSAGTTTLVNSATTVLDNTPSWGMALSADTTNGCLKIEVTGAAATNIRWVATIHTSEVTYA